MPQKRTPQPIGKRFGMVTLIEELPDRIKVYGKIKVQTRMSLIECDCGAKKRVIYGNLLYGCINSCGCSFVRIRMETIKRNHNISLQEHKSLTPERIRISEDKQKKLTNIQMIENGLINNALGMSWCSLMHERTREFLDLTK